MREVEAEFEICLNSSGAVYPVPPDKSVLQVLREAGLMMPSSCEVGVCGTCVTGVLEGVPDHQDMYFTDDEHARNDRFTPCCSRSLTRRLLLDL